MYWSNGITICSAETLHTLESLALDTISNATCSMVTDRGSYIVSSYDRGLCEVDSRGEQLCVICPGDFMSVNIIGDTVYSYEVNNSVVCVKRCVSGVGWERVSEVELQYGDGVSDRSVYGCVVTRDDIYVSWGGEMSGRRYDNVSKHDLSGHHVARYGSYGRWTASDAGLLYFPYISDVDGAGRMLVSDRCNDRVQVCSDEGEWWVVGGILGVKGGPLAAAVSNNTVWLGCDYPNYLHKYVVS